MNNLFPELSQALSPDGVIPITDFGVIVKSRYELDIYYNIGDQEISAIVDIDIEYWPYEPMGRDYPGCPASVQVIDIFGLSVAEHHAFDEWSLDNDLEAAILEAIKKEKEMM